MTVPGSPVQGIFTASRIVPRDFFGLLVIPFIIGLMTVSYVEGLTMVMALYGVCLSGIFVIYSLYHRLEIQPEVVVYFVWITWSLGGLTNVIDRALYFQQLMTVIQIGALFFVIAGITALRRNLSPVMLALLLGGVAVSLSSIVTGELTRILLGIGSVRADGMTGNANQFAYCMMFVIFAVFYFSRRRPSVIMTVLLSGSLLLAVMSIVFSGSRKALIGLLAFFFFWWLFCRRKSLSGNPLKEYAVVLLLLFGAVFATDYVLTHTYMGARLTDMQNRGNRMRVQMYEEGLKMITRNPVWGVGLNNFRVHSLSGLYSHSDYIEVASTTGVVGFMLYFSIYGILWLRLSSVGRMTDNPDVRYVTGFIKAALLTILLIAVGRPNITSKLTWIFLAGAVGYSWSLQRALLRVKALTADDRGRGA